VRRGFGPATSATAWPYGRAEICSPGSPTTAVTHQEPAHALNARGPKPAPRPTTDCALDQVGPGGPYSNRTVHGSPRSVRWAWVARPPLGHL